LHGSGLASVPVSLSYHMSPLNSTQRFGSSTAIKGEVTLCQGIGNVVSAVPLTRDGERRNAAWERIKKKEAALKAALVLTVIRCVASLLKMLYEVVWE